MVFSENQHRSFQIQSPEPQVQTINVKMTTLTSMCNEEGRGRGWDN